MSRDKERRHSKAAGRYHKRFAALVVVTVCLDLAPITEPYGSGTRQYQDEFPAVARYYRVVDLLFPRKLVGTTPSLILLTLRYIPAFEKESQVVISKKLDGAYTVTYYSLPSGSERIGEQISRLIQESKVEDPPAIAERIKVRVRNVDVPSGVMSDLMRRYAKLRVSPDLGLDPTMIILDATRYELWFQIVGSDNEFRISSPGDDYGHDQKAHPLVRWMNEVKRVVEKYAPKD